MANFSRRTLLQLPAAGILAAQANAAIPRRALVERHNPVLRAARFVDVDLRSPLQVGNGRFAFGADITGLQTFAEKYEQSAPLCTMSEWGWHHFANPEGYSLDKLRLKMFESHGRSIGYPVEAKGQERAFNYLRENPHRLHLGRIGLWLPGVGAEDLHDIEQTLDLWNGELRSRFSIGGTPVEVTTWCHPELDSIAVRVVSKLVRDKRIGVRLEFPNASSGMTAADWTSIKHSTTWSGGAGGSVTLLRRLDATQYQVAARWSGTVGMELDERPHRFLVRPKGDSETFWIRCHFSPGLPARTVAAEETASAAKTHWNRFWSTGGAVSLDGDPRSKELERRVVLSQYQTAIQCAGSMPPQETGLACNSWYGKFHLEMHWWHAAHFAIWGRASLLDRSLGWYAKILPQAAQTARKQGYAGARWPKMTSPSGIESPSNIGPLLIWQQPHPILMAELVYQSRPRRDVLERYAEMVFASAEFMASYAVLDAKSKRYVLGPPLIPAQENHPPTETWNPTFELEYWAQGLRTAQQLRVRLGMRREPKWDAIEHGLAPLPVKDGVYLAHENCPQTFTERNTDHPSMLMALGVLDGLKVDRETMRRTLRKVLDTWNWPTTWGWDYPVMAMTAARLGERELAVDALLMDTPKNQWLANGHTWQRLNLPCYLPSNGGLLLAVGMMAGAGAFPKTWQVTAEGIRKYGWSTA